MKQFSSSFFLVEENFEGFQTLVESITLQVHYNFL